MSKKPYDAIEKVCSTGWPPPEENTVGGVTVEKLIVVLNTATAAIGAMTQALLEARARVAAAQKVIEPFAKEAGCYSAKDLDDDSTKSGDWLQVGHLRDAQNWMDEALGINGKQAQDSP